MPDLKHQLKNYVEKMDIENLDLENITAKIEAAEHDLFIKHICDLLILNKLSKTNAVWLWGAANAGKTQFFKRLS